MITSDDVIYELTKLYLEEFDKKEDKFVMTKKQLIDFCLKMMKIIKRIEDEK